MHEPEHGLQVESIPRRPGATKLPVTDPSICGATGYLSGLSSEAQRSVAEVLTRHSPIVRAALQAVEIADDTEADRAGAT
jgi:hypothetical protein